MRYVLILLYLLPIYCIHAQSSPEIGNTGKSIIELILDNYTLIDSISTDFNMEGLVDEYIKADSHEEARWYKLEMSDLIYLKDFTTGYDGAYKGELIF